MTLPLRLVHEQPKAVAITLQLPGGAELAVTGPAVIRVDARGRVQVEPEGVSSSGLATMSQQPVAIAHTTQCGSLDSLRDAWLAHLRGRGRAPKYIQGVEYAISQLLAATTWTELSHVDPARFDQYLTARRNNGWSAKTHDNHLGVIRAWGSYLVKTQRWQKNVFAALELIGNSTGERGQGSRAPTTDELRAIIRAAEYREAHPVKPQAYRRSRVYIVASLTGLRHGELTLLERRECRIDEKSPYIEIDARKAKNRKLCKIPLCAEAATTLRAEFAEFPRRGKAFQAMPSHKTFRADLERAGVPYRDERDRKLTFHGLRKFLATTLIESGADLLEVKQLMRHSDIKMTLSAYNDVVDSRLVSAVSALPTLNGAMVEELGDTP